MADVTYVLGIFDSKNLLFQILEVIEGRLGCDGVDEDKALAIFHV